MIKIDQSIVDWRNYLTNLTILHFFNLAFFNYRIWMRLIIRMVLYARQANRSLCNEYGICRSVPLLNLRWHHRISCGNRISCRRMVLISIDKQILFIARDNPPAPYLDTQCNSFLIKQVLWTNVLHKITKALRNIRYGFFRNLGLVLCHCVHLYGKFLAPIWWNVLFC